MNRSFGIVACLCLGAMAAGCAPAPDPAGLKGRADLDAHYVNPGRLDKGVVIILPGIEGESPANRDIRLGLDEAGVPYALAIFQWGCPIPGLGMLMNQTDTASDRRAAADLAKVVVWYQKEYPGRPVFLAGHSGGGGVAIFTLEALAETPDAQPIAGAILLSSSISADYPLEASMRMVKLGIVNGYNRNDTFLLGEATAFWGNVDGGHGDSAGRTGFHQTYPKLFQFKVPPEIAVRGDPHFVMTAADLVAAYAPAWILSPAWPPPTFDADRQLLLGSEPAGHEDAKLTHPVKRTFAANPPVAAAEAPPRQARAARQAPQALLRAVQLEAVE